MNKKIPLLLCALLCAIMLCSCSIKSKKSLVSYAKQNYGACDFVKQESEGEGNNATRTVWLIDKDTGIEYTVTSRLVDMNIDGSSFGYTESTSSNFLDLYWDYVIDKAQTELNDAEKEFDADLSNLPKIIFNNRPKPEHPEQIATHVSTLIKKYDEKNLLNPTILVYSENETVYLGVYDAKTNEWTGNDSYIVIDFVKNVFPDAEYKSDIYGTPESYVDYDDLEKLINLGAKELNTFDTEFFFFSEPKYGTIIAFNMDEIGLNGIFVGSYKNYVPGKTLYCEALDIKP